MFLFVQFCDIINTVSANYSRTETNIPAPHENKSNLTETFRSKRETWRSLTQSIVFPVFTLAQLMMTACLDQMEWPNLSLLSTSGIFIQLIDLKATYCRMYLSFIRWLSTPLPNTHNTQAVWIASQVVYLVNKKNELGTKLTPSWSKL